VPDDDSGNTQVDWHLLAFGMTMTGCCNLARNQTCSARGTLAVPKLARALKILPHSPQLMQVKQMYM
jgi:hypothetical protein